MTLVLSDEDRDFLQHYGVKGMKWGVRRSQAQLDRAAGRSSKKSARKESRRKNKEQRKEQQAERSRSISKARKDLREGVPQQRVRDAKKKYKQDKQRIGRKEARKILNKERDRLISDLELAQEPRNVLEAIESAIDPSRSITRIYRED